MRLVVARALLIGAGAAAGAGGTIVATTVISDDERGIVRAHLVEYADAGCLRSGTENSDTLGLLHTGSGRKRQTQAQIRAEASLDSLLSLKCVTVAQLIDTLPPTPPVDTSTSPPTDTTTVPDTTQPPPPPPPPVDTTTPPDTTTPGPAPADTTNEVRAFQMIAPFINAADTKALGGPAARFDSTFAKHWTLRWATDGASWVLANYYDRCAILFAMYVRTGDVTLLQQANAICDDYRRKYLVPNTYGASPHWSQLDGLALQYWITGNDSARITVGHTARRAFDHYYPILGSTTNKNMDPRIQARALQAYLLSWQTNAPNAPTGGWGPRLDTAITRTLSTQAADGAWRHATLCNEQLNYMAVMLTDILARIHYAYRQDPAIDAAARRSLAFLKTQWRTDGSFNYGSAACSGTFDDGSAWSFGPYAAPDINGLFAPPFAWSGDVTMAASIIDGAWRGAYIMAAGSSKQFNQTFNAYRALGYLR